MYLVYESLYGDLLQECDSTNIIGLYSDLNKAKEVMNNLIKEDIEQNNYVLDYVECDTFKRLFWNKQENWNCYYEIYIEEIKCQ